MRRRNLTKVLRVADARLVPGNASMRHVGDGAEKTDCIAVTRNEQPRVPGERQPSCGQPLQASAITRGAFIIRHRMLLPVCLHGGPLLSARRPAALVARSQSLLFSAAPRKRLWSPTDLSTFAESPWVSWLERLAREQPAHPLVCAADAADPFGDPNLFILLWHLYFNLILINVLKVNAYKCIEKCGYKNIY